jgi:phosphinothricin acetyltransferase
VTGKIAIAAMTVDHWPTVERICAAGIATGHATFESAPPDWKHFDAGKLSDQRLVAVDEAGQVLGWVAAAPVSDRCVYAGVVEHSVYVDPRAQGRGIGRLLLDALVASTELAGIWTIQSGIFPENAASLALHRAVGFRKVGVRERVGRMTYGPWAEQWRDVVLIERRSPSIGGRADVWSRDARRRRGDFATRRRRGQ